MALFSQLLQLQQPPPTATADSAPSEASDTNLDMSATRTAIPANLGEVVSLLEAAAGSPPIKTFGLVELELVIVGDDINIPKMIEESA